MGSGEGLGLADGAGGAEVVGAFGAEGSGLGESDGFGLELEGFGSDVWGSSVDGSAGAGGT